MSAFSSVVIVDDDPDYAMVARLMFARLLPDTTVASYDTRAELLEALPAIPRRSLVLLDRRLGASESFDLLASASASRPDIDIVMMSSLLSSAERARALHHGAVGAIEKPSSMAGWCNVLATLLDDTETATRAA